MQEQVTHVDVDRPLPPGRALQDDLLGRQSFANGIAKALRSVSRDGGLVVSIEGRWGSGKTTLLAMVQEILSSKGAGSKPVIVHFNPWLVGDRDALLREFLSTIGAALKLPDHAKDGKKVAREIEAYAKAFDVLKLIPGVEPWASIVKSVFESVGKATGSVAEHKTRTMEQQKGRVESALRDFSRQVFVFIDDIDRLFPNEVYEMVRIVKAVGDLPNIGYVLAWDPDHVSAALEQCGKSWSAGYLDKIVQVRAPIPRMSGYSREKMFVRGIESLPSDALSPDLFPNSQERLSDLYVLGLRDLFDEPRDFARVFNAVRLMEQQLRGEIVFADILAVAALSVKASNTFQLIRTSPDLFAGPLSSSGPTLKKKSEIVAQGKEIRAENYNRDVNPAACKQIVHALFPLVADDEDGIADSLTSEGDGRIGHPSRLAIALQFGLSTTDVSLGFVREYVRKPDLRQSIESQLTAQNCLEFLELVGDYCAVALGSSCLTDRDNLIITLARFADCPSVVERGPYRTGFPRPARMALRSMDSIATAFADPEAEAIAARIVGDAHALSVAASLVSNAIQPKSHSASKLRLSAASKGAAIQSFLDNVISAAKTGRLFSTSAPIGILGAVAASNSGAARAVFQVIQANDAQLDRFVLEWMSHAHDSYKGQIFRIPNPIGYLEEYSPIDELRGLGIKRLEDSTISLPARVAWRALVEGKQLYCVDGSEASWPAAANASAGGSS